MNTIRLHPVPSRVLPFIVLLSCVISGCSFFPSEVRYEEKSRHYSVSPNEGAEVFSQAAHDGDSYSVGAHAGLTEHYILKEGPYAVAEAPPASYDGMMAADGAAGSQDRGEGAGKTTIVIEASDVLFDFDKSVIKKIYYPVLDEWVLFFRESPHVIAQIFGHTDSIGTDAYNQKLSERRARAVFNYLVDNGIDQARLKTHGFGENMPVAPNTTPEGRQKNRRVEVNY